MPTYNAPLRDMRFVAHEVFAVADTLTALPGYEDASADLIDVLRKPTRNSQRVGGAA